MRINCKRLLVALLLVCLNVGMFTMVASAASKLSTPEVTLTNVESTGKIKISWKSVKNAVSYKVYRSTDGENWSRIFTTKKRSVTNTSPVAGKTYYYKVRAIASKSSRNSEYSEVQSIVCDLKRPSISLSTISDTGKTKVSWKEVSKAVAYEVFRSVDKEEWESFGTTEDTKWIDETGVPGEKYYYKVKAIAEIEDANSALSTYKYRYTDLARPVVTLSDHELTGKTVISWEPVEGALKYRVYRSSNKSYWTRMTTTEDTSYHHSNAIRGKKYYYRVKAYCDVSSSASAYSLIKYRTCGQKPTIIPDQKPDDEPENDLTYHVSHTNVSLYKSASSSSTRISIPYMAKVEFAEPVKTGGKWNKVYYEGKTYYVWIEKLSDKFTSGKSSFSYECDNKYQQEVVDLAVDIALNWNTEYAHGQSDGEKNSNGKYGFDCSGFVSYLLNTVMQKEIPPYKLTSSVAKLCVLDEVFNAGYSGEFKVKKIDKDDIQPGDVIFWSQDSTNDHCGIYLGNGEFAHASSSWDDVCIMPFKGIYIDDLSMIRRFIPDEIIEANTTATVSPASGSSACGIYETLGDDDKIDTVKKGTRVTVIFNGNGDSNSQAWVKIESGEYQGTECFIYSKNLKK